MIRVSSSCFGNAATLRATTQWGDAMTTSCELQALLDRMTAAAEAGDSAGFAAAFTPDGAHHDYIYGDHRGRAAYPHMLAGTFLRDASDHHMAFLHADCKWVVKGQSLTNSIYL